MAGRFGRDAADEVCNVPFPMPYGLGREIFHALPDVMVEVEDEKARIDGLNAHYAIRELERIDGKWKLRTVARQDAEAEAREIEVLGVGDEMAEGIGRAG